MKRIFDIVFSVFALSILFAPMIIIGGLVRITSDGPALYWSKRIGKNNVEFKMPKFRTMKINTPEVATHLLESAEMHLTPVGKFLRRYSLDELPQFFSVIKGDMSLVGPRPALYNQDKLIALRKEYGLDKLLPGITGWAQVNGRDDLSIIDKITLDKEYIDLCSFWFDIRIIWLTLLKVLKPEGVAH